MPENLIDLNNFDLSVNPGEDFNLFCNGKWKINNNIPADRSRWGTFDELDELNYKQILNIIKNIKKDTKNLNDLKIIDFWKSAKFKINQKDFNSIKSILLEVSNIKKKKDIYKILGKLHNFGINIFFIIYASQDAKKSQFVIPHIYSTGLNLSDRDFYLNEDKNNIIKQYRLFLKKLLKHINSIVDNNENNLNNQVENIINIEKNIAQNLLPRDELRNPQLIYNKYTLNNLNNYFSEFDWNQYLAAAKIEKPDYIVIDQPAFIEGVEKIIKKYDLEIIKDYIYTRILIDFLPFLNDELDELHFNFFGKIINGIKKQKPLEKRIISWMNGVLGEILGKKYVECYFTEKSKKKALVLVDDIINVFRDRLINLEWMHNETKKKAIKKLDNMNIKIGYPNIWRDYSDLKINSHSLISNILESNKFEWKFELSKMNKPVNRDLWEILPQKINAYYHPELNEIVFPAAILQKPFFSDNADDAVNYGGIGTVIGHEITHGFDDQGRKYNFCGNLDNWWKDSDKKKFNILANKLVMQFNKCKINDSSVNGKLTLGENIADLGGLMIAYSALKKKMIRENKKIENIDKNIKCNIFTNKQRFFISWAQIWRSNITDAKQYQLLLTDPHSPNQFRINEPLKNIPDFFDAFNITEGQKMRKSKLDLINIW